LKLEKLYWNFGGVLGVVGKPLGNNESDLIDFISQFLELRCGRY
jgi:hypothetical protein